jgi:cytochrome c oxidase assembly factor CtaG
MLAAAPLLVLGMPLAPMLWGLPATWRTGVGRTLQARSVRAVGEVLLAPLVVGMIGTVALWLWHIPSLYEAALRHEAAHAAEHASFLGAALLFWGVVLPAGHRRVRAGAALLLVFVMMVQSGALGALILFARSPLYAAHEAGAVAWGLTPLQDQQLAGTIMWVPTGAVYLLAALWLVAAWLRAMERATPAYGPGPGERVVVPRASEGGIA